MARREVFRLFPEFQHSLVLVQVYIARYAEIDWESGRCIVAKLRSRTKIPACVAEETKPERKKLPRLEDEEAFNDPNLGTPFYWEPPRCRAAFTQESLWNCNRDFSL